MQVDITGNVSLLAVIVAAAIALAEIGYQFIRAGLTCPVENLRSE